MRKIRAKFTKCKNSKYISHLDLMRLFQRAFRRAGIDLAHTEGFNRQPKLAFATALSLGTSSVSEYLDVETIDEIELEKFVKDINEVLPEGVRVLKAEYRTEKASVASLIVWGVYEIEVRLINELDTNVLKNELEKFINLEDLTIIRDKRKKRKVTKVDENIRVKIESLDFVSYEDKKLKFKTTILTGSEGSLRPEFLIDALDKYTNIEIDKTKTKTHRLELLTEDFKEIL